MNLNLKKLSAAIFAVAIVGGITAICSTRGENPDTPIAAPYAIDRMDAAVHVADDNPDAKLIPASGAPATPGRSPAADFEKNQLCFYARNEALAMHEIEIECESLAGVKEVEQVYKQCKRDQAGYEVRRRKLAPVLSQCSGTNADILDFYRASTKAAAQQGNADAQLCYLQSAFGEEANYSAKDEREYDRDSQRYIRLAMQRGDWRIVELLGSYRFHPGSGLLPRIVKGDLATRYQMNRLARLGASGEYAQELDRHVQYDLLSHERRGDDALTQQQIGEAEWRAHDLYKKYFAGSPPLTERPIACRARWSS